MSKKDVELGENVVDYRALYKVLGIVLLVLGVFLAFDSPTFGCSVVAMGVLLLLAWIVLTIERNLRPTELGSAAVGERFSVLGAYMSFFSAVLGMLPIMFMLGFDMLLCLAALPVYFTAFLGLVFGVRGFQIERSRLAIAAIVSSVVIMLVELLYIVFFAPKPTL